MKFFELAFDALLPKSRTTRIIDFGSLDINGGPHLLLEPFKCKYIGVDLDEGANVNLVSRGELVDYSSASFDIAMSSELFEHAPTWREIFYNMCRLTKPGGIVLLSCAGRFRPEHGTTRSDKGLSAPFVVSQGVEYYGNVSGKKLRSAISMESWFDRYGVFENHWSHDTYFVGIRKGSTDQALANFELLINDLEDLYSRSFPLSQILILKSLIFKRIPILVKFRNLIR